MSQCYVIKQMVNAILCTIELWMFLGGLLSTQEARVAQGYLTFVLLTCLATSRVHPLLNSTVTLWQLPFVNFKKSGFQSPTVEMVFRKVLFFIFKLLNENLKNIFCAFHP